MADPTPEDDADTLIREWASQLAGPSKPKGATAVTFYWLTIVGILTVASFALLFAAGIVSHLLYWPIRWGWNLL
jgi:hypothetical protein